MTDTRYSNYIELATFKNAEGKIENGVRFRTTVVRSYPELGFTRYGKAATIKETINFANDLLAAAAEAEKLNKKSLLPENWPPRPGDVWRRDSPELDYFIGSNVALASGADKSGVYQHYSLEGLLRAVEQRGEKYTLAYRRNVKEAK